MIRRPVHAHDAASLAFAIASVVVACVGAAKGWPAVEVSRAVVALSSAAVLVRRRDGSGIGPAVAVLVAAEAPGIVQAAAMAQ
jgi:hypothetical protein